MKLRGGTGADTQKQPHTRMPATALGAPLRNQPRQPAAGSNCKTQNTVTVSKKNYEQLHDLRRQLVALPWTGEADAVFAGGCRMLVEFAMVC